MEDEKDPNKVAGGLARAEALDAGERQEIARKAAEARWALPKATHAGDLHIAGAVIPCAVLEDGRRVMSRAGLIKAIGRRGKAKGGRKYDQESQVPVFLTAGNLNAFVSEDLISNSKPVPFRPLKGGSASIGYLAELLPQVCNVFLDAKDAGVLKENQKGIAERCKMLVRGFAVVGITALVDEATNYQEVRDRLALQEILDKYLRREFAAWAKRFPDEFYQQIFRLRTWTWKGMKVNRPQVVATYTKDIVYARIAPGILNELEHRNPKNEKGNRKAKHHQWLTEDVGHDALAQHLYGVIGLMRAAESWDQFKTMLNRAYPRRGDTLDLPLFSRVTA